VPTVLDFTGGLLIVVLFSAAVVTAVYGVLSLGRALDQPPSRNKRDKPA
jgi:hypothetical protein